VNPKTVRRWVASRRMPCVRVGTRLRFDVGDIVSWVRQRKEG
jgi:excisionase family DNA binding protein